MIYVNKDFLNKPDGAIEGLFDLRVWNVEERGTHKLTGEWEFYQGIFITPVEGKQVFDEYADRKQFIYVPGIWDKYLNDGKGSDGFGTYRLLINVPEDRMYGVKTKSIRYANRAFMNGIEIGVSGLPSDSIDEYISSNMMYAGYAMSKQGQVELVFQVANYKTPNGGITEVVSFGTYEEVVHLRDWQRTLDALLVSGYLILGLYFLGSYLQRKKDVYLLYFSVFCILLSLYTSTLNERLLDLILRDMSTLELARIQFSTILLALVCFILFIYYYFKEYANKMFVTILSVFILLYMCWLVIFMDGNMTVHGLALLIVIPIISIIYILWILFRVIRSRSKGSEYVFIVITTIVCYGAILVVNFIYSIDLSYVPVPLFLGMIMGMALMMSYRSQLAFVQVDHLSKELIVYDQLKDEFLAKTSHELRTPLHVVLNLSQSLMEGKSGTINDSQYESIMLINTVGKRMSLLVNDLLDASAIKHGELSMMRAPFNIKCLGEILEEMKYLIPADKPVILRNLLTDDNLYYVFGDINRIKQVVFNLIINAVKYTDEGEISLLAEAKNDYVYISVVDTGIGIEDEQLGRIFSQFYQVRDDMNEKVEGLGLGLGIAREIVELHGGKLSAKSALGKGSVFTFSLPRYQSLAAIDKYLSNKHEFSNVYANANPKLHLPLRYDGEQDITVLLVDDEHINLRVLLQGLNSTGYNLIAVDSGEAAIEIINQEPIDIIVLDLMMAGMSGFDVCQKVREEYTMLELPILILTAAGQMSSMISSFQSGANDFLNKPVNMDELKIRINSLLMTRITGKNAMKAELNYLQAQISPHFLYNTFNTIIGLSYKDIEKAREALEYLAIYFRAKLNFFNKQIFISIKDELELVNAYLSIEKIRFTERLQVVMDIDESIDVLIPSLTIQPLVENALMHGLQSKTKDGIIEIIVKKSDDNVIVIVRDNGVGISKQRLTEILTNKTGRIGFSNVLKKIKLIKHAKIDINSIENNGTTITIVLPRG
jgi:signal transduction histidine kinase